MLPGAGLTGAATVANAGFNGSGYTIGTGQADLALANRTVPPARLAHLIVRRLPLFPLPKTVKQIGCTNSVVVQLNCTSHKDTMTAAQSRRTGSKRDWDVCFMKPGQATIINKGTTVIGSIEGNRAIDVFGSVEGELIADKVTVHPDGSVIGQINSKTADVDGRMEGEIKILNLISIGASGNVSGKVEYGELAVVPGGHLEATVHNIPPTLTGDLDLSVSRGKHVTITTRDLNAVDPDDVAADLIFRVSNAANGWLALASETAKPINSFTQADLLAKRIAFVHDGNLAATAGFEVFIADKQGATSGPPASVRIEVQSQG